MESYVIHQFTDKNLAQYGYLVQSGNEAAVVDPARDITEILGILEAENLTLKAVIETHPHADFVSGHLELSQVTGAPVYISTLLGAEYEHRSFDQGDRLRVGSVELEALNTPGHSPDSISILLRDENDAPKALFSGDTLFVGDVGRPDLREKAGNIQAKREELAGMMYETVQNVLRPLPDDVVVYPAHGAGTLCGKSLRDAPSTTIGEECRENPAFREMTKDEFIQMLTEGQPMIPQYFGYDVALNRKGAVAYRTAIESVPMLDAVPEGVLVVDTRDLTLHGRRAGAIHIPLSGIRFETWLGTVISPDEKFVLIAENESDAASAVSRAAKIGYESQIAGVVLGAADAQTAALDLEAFKAHPDRYTVVDVRQQSEHAAHPIFSQSLNVPLNELRQRIPDVPTDKPVVVHCAGGYRSMIGSSILADALTVPVYDMGEEILKFRA